MFRVALKGVLARKLRLALTMAAIVLGVTFVTGSLVLTDSSSRLFEDLFTKAAENVDLVVRTESDFDSAMGVEVEHDPVPEAVIDRIRAAEGVAGAEGVVKGQALLSTHGGAAIVPKGASLGASWVREPYGSFGLREGRAPAADGEVAVDAATVSAYGMSVGDQVTVQAHGAPERFTIVGTVGFGDRAGVPGSTVALFEVATAQRVLDVADGFSEVLVVAEDDVTATTLRDRVADAVGDGYAVSTSQDSAAASAAAAKEQLNYLTVLLGVLAVTALLVGSFLIANTFSIIIGQRTREFAMLRAVGATGRQVLTAVLGEALVVGIAASAVGTGLGVAAATGLRSLAGAFDVDLPEGPLVVSPRTLLVGMLIGVVVTLVAAVGPARRAARVAPVEAMRNAATVRAVSVRRRVIGALVTGVGLAVVVGIAVGAIPSLLAVGAAALLILAGLAILAPVFASGLASAVGGPIARTGLPGRFARDAARRAPRRTAATSIALALGLAVVGFMTVLGASLKGSVNGAFDEVIQADYVIESARNEMLGGLSPHVYHHVSELPEVAAITRMRFGHWHDAGSTQALTAVDPATLPDLADLDITAGSLSALAQGGVVITEQVASDRGLGVGDEFSMTFARTGDQRLPIVGLLEDGDEWAVSTAYLVSLETYAQHFTEDVDASVMVKLADGVTGAEGEAVIRDTLSDFPTAAVRDIAEARLHRTRTFDMILGLVTVLLLLAVLIALLGITNTLALSIVERTREVGLLRAVGMSRRQVGAMIRWEALLVAVLGAIVGVGLGIAFGWIALRALASRAAIEMVVPGVQLGAYLAIAALAGVIAGVIPARRAARLDVLRAIAVE